MAEGTLREIAGEFRYVSQAALLTAARESRIRARKSGGIWLTTAEAVEEAIEAGRILTSAPWLERFWSKVGIQGPDDCWEWKAGRNGYGYGCFWTGRRIERSHRIAWELVNEQEIPDELFVCHHCDNPACCNPDHLHLGTCRDNSRDCVVRGRVGKSKLDWGAVRDIRARVAAGETQAALARDYKITGCAVSYIVHGKRWWPDPLETGEASLP